MRDIAIFFKDKTGIYGPASIAELRCYVASCEKPGELLVALRENGRWCVADRIRELGLRPQTLPWWRDDSVTLAD